MLLLLDCALPLSRITELWFRVLFFFLFQNLHHRYYHLLLTSGEGTADTFSFQICIEYFVFLSSSYLFYFNHLFYINLPILHCLTLGPWDKYSILILRVT